METFIVVLILLEIGINITMKIGANLRPGEEEFNIAPFFVRGCWIVL